MDWGRRRRHFSTAQGSSTLVHRGTGQRDADEEIEPVRFFWSISFLSNVLMWTLTLVVASVRTKGVNHMSETFGGFLRWWWKKKKKKIKPRGDEGGYKRLAPQPRERDIYIPLSKSVVLNLPLFFGQEIRRQVEMGRGANHSSLYLCCPIGKLPGNYIGKGTRSHCCVYAIRVLKIREFPWKLLTQILIRPLRIGSNAVPDGRRGSISKNTLPRSSAGGSLNSKHHVKGEKYKNHSPFWFFFPLLLYTPFNPPMLYTRRGSCDRCRCVSLCTYSMYVYRQPYLSVRISATLHRLLSFHTDTPDDQLHFRNFCYKLFLLPPFLLICLLLLIYFNLGFPVAKIKKNKNK